MRGATGGLPASGSTGSSMQHWGVIAGPQYLLDELVPDGAHGNYRTRLGNYIVKLARLGGYFARAHDPPPGNTVIWRGLSRLTDIELGIMIGAQLVGN